MLLRVFLENQALWKVVITSLLKSYTGKLLGENVYNILYATSVQSCVYLC